MWDPGLPIHAQLRKSYAILSVSEESVPYLVPAALVLLLSTTQWDGLADCPAAERRFRRLGNGCFASLSMTKTTVVRAAAPCAALVLAAGAPHPRRHALVSPAAMR